MLGESHPSAGGDRAASLVVWVIAFALLFGAFVMAAGTSRQRRSHFWLRVLALPVVPAALTAALIGIGELELLPEWLVETSLMMLVFLIVPALLLAPALLYRRPGPSDDDDGPGRGPSWPPTPPPTPRGGVPLPDAEQSRTRRRDHERVHLGGPRPRRPAREPGRPVRETLQPWAFTCWCSSGLRRSSSSSRVPIPRW